uniref:NACHT domain-containing protein n=1 Tax=Dendroctonus ponderosae TaxID=77166 RepID=A0AAR5P3J4_DENPD
MASTSNEDSDFHSDPELSFKRQLIDAVLSNDPDQLMQVTKNSTIFTPTFVNTQDKNDNSNTLLHLALKKRSRKVDQRKNKEIIKFLLDHKADIHAKNDRNQSALEVLERKCAGSTSSEVDWGSIKQLFDLSNGKFPGAGAGSLKSGSKTPNLPGTKRQKISLPEISESIDQEEFTFSTNETYGASGLKTSIDGVVYQLQLLLLFLHRSLSHYHSIYLASEIDEAEKFDDVALKYKKSPSTAWLWRFVQAKHLLYPAKQPITPGQLFSIAPKQDAKFSLHKYMHSFSKIKQNQFFSDSTLEEFTICTNAMFNPKAMMYFVEDKHFSEDRILFFPNTLQTKRYKLLPAAAKNIRTVYQSIEKTAIDEQHLKEFMKKFRFIANYPNRVRLNQLISREMSSTFGLLDPDLATTAFKNSILNWFMSYKDQKSEFLLIKDGNAFLRQIRRKIEQLMTAGISLAYPEKLFTYQMEFENIPQNFEEISTESIAQILHVVSEAPLLSAIKVNQHLASLSQKKDLVIFLPIAKLCGENLRKLILGSFASSVSHHLLVVDAGATKKLKKSVLNSLCRELLEILCSNASKKVVIIGDCRNSLVSQLVNANSIRCLQMADCSNFEDLSPRAQEIVLKKKIYLQGRKTPLGGILNLQAAKRVLSQTLLLNILKDVDVRIDEPSILEQGIDGNYVSRTFNRQVVKRQILSRNRFLEQNLVLISQATPQDLADLNASKRFVRTCEADVKTGIVLLPAANESRFVQSIRRQHPQQNIYWLEYSNKNLLLEGVFGSIAPLMGDLQHFAGDDLIPEENFLKSHPMGNKRFILSGEPGSGKSSFLSHLQLSFQHPNQWIKRINLNHYLAPRMPHRVLLEDVNFAEDDQEKAVEFLTNMLFGAEESPLGKQLFAQALNNTDKTLEYPQLLLLFDGFDEISPNYRPQTLTLLKGLQNSSFAQLWVSTRLHEQSALMLALNNPALLLSSFTRAQKLDYIDKYVRVNKLASDANLYLDLCSQLGGIKLSTGEDNAPKDFYSRKNRFAKHLDHSQRVLQDALEIQFTNIPLHLRMLADISFTSKSSNLKSLKLPELYQRFVKTKFAIFYEEKSSTTSAVLADKDMRRSYLKTLTRVHQQIACALLFPSGPFERPATDEDQALIRVGLLYRNYSQSTLDFIHRSFAEYFAAEYLQENLRSAAIQQLLFQQVLMNDEYKLIRTFFNGSEAVEDQFQLCRTQMEVLILEASAMWRYYKVLVTEELGNVLRASMLLAMELKPDSLKTFIHSQITKLFMLVVLILHSKEVFLALFDSVMNSTIIQDYQKRYGMNLACKVCHATQVLFKFFDGLDLTGFLEQIFQTALQVEAADALHCLWDMVKHIDEKKETLLHIAAKRGRFDFIQQLLSWVQSKQLVLNESMGDLSRCAIKNSDCKSVETRSFLCSSADALGNMVKFLILQTTTFTKKTFLHVMAYGETFQEFLNYLLGIDREAAEVVLRAPQNDGTTVINYFLKQKDGQSMEALLNTLQRQENLAFAKTLIFDLDNFKILVDFVEQDDNDAYLLLLRFSMRILDRHEFERLLHGSDSNQQTLLDHTVIHLGPLQELLAFLQHFSSSVIKAVVFHRDSKRQTALHVAARVVQSSNCCQLLLDFTKTNLGLDFLCQLLFAEDVFGSTVLHWTGRNHFGFYQACTDLVSYSKANLSSAVFRELLCKPDTHHQTFLFLTEKAPVDEKKILAMMSLLGNEDFIQLISRADDQCMTIFHFILNRPTVSAVLTVIISRLEACLDWEQVVKKILFQVDKKGRTALHCTQPQDLANIPGDFQSFSVLFRFCLRYFGTQTIKELLLKKDNEQKCVLHHAASYSFKPEGLYDSLKLWCQPDGIRDLLINFDANRQTPLHAALLLSESAAPFLALLQLAAGLDVESRTELLFSKDIHGNTILHYSPKEFKDGCVISDLLCFARAHLRPQLFLTFLNSQNLDRCSFIQRDALDNSSLVIWSVFDHLTAEEVENFLRSTLLDGRPFLQFLVCTIANAQTIDDIFQLLERKLDRTVFEELICFQDRALKTVLHYPSPINSKLQQRCLDSVDPGRLKALLVLSDQNGQTVLHHMVCEHNALTLLDLIGSHVHVDLLRQVDKDQRTVLHLAAKASKCKRVLVKLFQIIEAQSGPQSLHGDLLQLDLYGMNVLHLSSYNATSEQMLEHLLNFSRTTFPSDLWKRFLTATDSGKKNILHHSAGGSHSETFQALVQFLQANLDLGLFRELMTSSDSSGNTVLHHLVSHRRSSETMKVYLGVLQETVNSENVENFLARSNRLRKTALHLANDQLDENDAFKELLAFAVNSPIFPSLLFWADDQERTILHYAATQPSAFSVLLTFIKTLNVVTQSELMLLRDSEGCSVLHFLVKHGKSWASLQDLLEVCHSLGSELLRQLLLAEISEGFTVLHCSAYSSDSMFIWRLMKFALLLGSEFFETFVCKEDKNQRNILHHAYFSRHEIPKLKTFGKYISSMLSKQATYSLCSKRDAFGKTPLHYFVSLGKCGLVNIFLELIGNVLDYEGFFQIMLIRDGSQRVPLHTVCTSESGCCFQSVLKVCWTHLKPEDFHELLSVRDEADRTVFHYSFEHFTHMHCGLAGLYLRKLGELFDRATVKSLTQMVDAQLNTPLHLAVLQLFSNMECEEFMQFLTATFTHSSELSQAITASNSIGKPPLHCDCFEVHQAQQLSICVDHFHCPMNDWDYGVLEMRATLTLIELFMDNFQFVFNDFIQQKLKNGQTLLRHVLDSMRLQGPTVLLDCFQNYIEVNACSFISLEAILLKKNACNATQLIKLYNLMLYKELMETRR